MEANSDRNSESVEGFSSKSRRGSRKGRNGAHMESRVEIGREVKRWNELKVALQVNDEDLAKLLIDRYDTDGKTSEKSEFERQNPRHSKRYSPRSCKDISSFNLTDYGVYFPEPEFGEETIPQKISTFDNVFNIDYGNDVETGNQAQHTHMSSPVPIHVTDPCAVARENAYLVYNSCLIQLANQNPPNHCTVKNCKGDVSMIKKNSGTSVYFTWTCSKGHVIREWCSQPSLQGQGHLGDLLLASGIEMSGSNYNQVALLLKTMNVEYLSLQSFEYLRSQFVVPRIISSWLREQADILSVLESREVILLGSMCQYKMEESSSFCTVCVLDYETAEVIYVSVVEGKKADGHNQKEKLELLAFSKALNAIEKAGGIVREVVTNVELKLNSYLKRKYPNVKRSFDMWEGAKFIGKTIVEASTKEGCSDLLPWLPDIVDHFLDCSNQCAELSGTLWAATDEEAFVDSFVTGIIHHTMNSHSWISGKCKHPPMEEDSTKPWLLPDSPAHNELKNSLLTKPLASIMDNFSTNRTTSGIELLQDYITVYTPDNRSYSFEEYKTRIYLAVMDYMNHQNRPVENDEDGKELQCRIYSKYTGGLLCQPKKKAKQYNYVPFVIEKIVGAALNSDLN